MPTTDYQCFAHSLRWLAQHYLQQPSLSEIAAQSGLSEHHFQRRFTQWVGVSPKRFVESLSVEHARQLLDRGASVLDASLDTGLSSPSRLHDLFLRHEALSPGEYKRGGAGLLIDYGVHLSPFGPVLLGVSERGVSSLVFVEPEHSEVAIEQMQARLPRAHYRHNQATTQALVEQIFAPLADGEIRLLLAGSPFQLSVWRALLRLGSGLRCSYGQLAAAVQKPAASRAVGSAVGANPIAVLIPCHRVIRADTGLGGYRWGLERKLALQAWESGLSDL